MQRPSNKQGANLRAVCLFISSGLSGACQKPATHSATPESAPVVTTGASPVSSTPTSDANTSQTTAASETTTSSLTGEASQAGRSNALTGSTALAGMPTSKELGVSTFSGCLGKPIAAQNNPTRGMRTNKPASFRVTPLGNGAIVTHEFGHACCLSASTETTQQDSTITIRERLVGTPCRCVCDSTIQTRVNVPPGDYQVQLVLDSNGVETQVGSESLTVKKLTGR